MIYVHLAKGFEEIEALTTVDILRRGNVPVKTVSITEDKLVEGAHGINVEADITFDQGDYDSCQMIVLPGGLPGADNLRDHEGLVSEIKKFKEEDKYIAAICASPARVLAYHNILGAKNATMYPGFEQEMGEANINNVGAVRDGNIITGKGPAFATEFALAILEAVSGKEIAEEVANDFLYER